VVRLARDSPVDDPLGDCQVEGDGEPCGGEPRQKPDPQPIGRRERPARVASR
jgi:hypothetical protein